MNSFPPFSKKILIAAAFATFALLSGTNISARNNDNIRPDRKTLYKKGFYSSTLLTEPPERGNDAKWMEEGYKVLSLIRLDIPNPEGVIDEYREKFKESPLIPQMLFECAIAHFDREEYSEAAKLFSSIPVKDLYKGQRDEFHFRKGYCQMRMGNNGEAGSDFAEITKKAGGQVILNPAPAISFPEELYKRIDLIIPNESEAEKLTGIAVDDEKGALKAAEWFADKGVKHVLITLGSRGVFLYSDGLTYLMAIFLGSVLSAVFFLGIAMASNPLSYFASIFASSIFSGSRSV